VTSTAALVVALAEGGGFNPLAFDPSAMALTIITFLVLLVLLAKFAWGPILKMAETREKRITDAIAEAESQRAEAQRLLEEHRKAMASVQTELALMREQGLAEAEKARQLVRKKAEAEAAELSTKARRDIELARTQALQDIRREAVDLGLAAASRVVGRSLDGNDQRRIAEEVVGGLAGVSAGGGTGTGRKGR
jgi:F-type H+-transporting ATPase subunit b